MVGTRNCASVWAERTTSKRMETTRPRHVAGSSCQLRIVMGQAMMVMEM
jgi:hypothetical protein